jgi:hypothetical protein
MQIKSATQVRMLAAVSREQLIDAITLYCKDHLNTASRIEGYLNRINLLDTEDLRELCGQILAMMLKDCHTQVFSKPKLEDEDFTNPVNVREIPVCNINPSGRCSGKSCLLL